MKKKKHKAAPDYVSLSIYLPAADKRQISAWCAMFANPYNPKPKPGHVVSALIDFAIVHNFGAPNSP